MNVKLYLENSCRYIYEDNPNCPTKPNDNEMYNSIVQAARLGMSKCVGFWLSYAMSTKNKSFEKAFLECCKYDYLFAFYFVRHLKKNKISLTRKAKRLLFNWAKVWPKEAVSANISGLSAIDLAKYTHIRLSKKPIGRMSYNKVSSFVENPSEIASYVYQYEQDFTKTFELLMNDDKIEISAAAAVRIDYLLSKVPVPSLDKKGIIFYDASGSLNYRYNNRNKWSDIIALILSAYSNTMIYPVHSKIESPIDNSNFLCTKQNVAKMIGNKYNPNLPFQALSQCENNPDWVLIISDRESLPLNKEGVFSGAYHEFKNKAPDTKIIMCDLGNGESIHPSHLRGFSRAFFHRIAFAVDNGAD